jgi:hypothetical protein
VRDGHRNGVPPGRLSWIPGPKPGGRAASGGGGGRNGPTVPSPPRCGAVPLAPPPRRADGDDSDRSASAAARGNAVDGNPLRNKDATTAAMNDAGQENDVRGGGDGDNNKDDDKWGRGA